MGSTFDFIVSFWDTTEYALANWIILGLMAPIAFVLAYKATGKASFIVGYNSTAMSIIHWIIRFFIYAILVYILKGMIWFLAQPLMFFGVSEPRFISSIAVAILLFGFAIFVKEKSDVNHKIFWR